MTSTLKYAQHCAQCVLNAYIYIQHVISQQVIDQELVNTYLQQVPVSVSVTNTRNSVESAKNHVIPVPSTIPTGMVIAVTPSSNSQDKYWVAQVTSTKSDSPLIYNIRYYNYSKVKHGWVLMKGEGAYD